MAFRRAKSTEMDMQIGGSPVARNQPTNNHYVVNEPARALNINFFFFQMVTFGSQNAQRVGRILQQSNAEIDGDVPIEGRFVMLTDEPSASHHHHHENNINQ